MIYTRKIRLNTKVTAQYAEYLKSIRYNFKIFFKISYEISLARALDF